MSHKNLNTNYQLDGERVQAAVLYCRADKQFVPLQSAEDFPKRLEWDKAHLARITEWLDEHLSKDPALSTAAGGLDKTVVDSQSGEYALINADRDTVTLKDKSGKILWSTNVVAALKATPILGDRKLNSVEVINGQIVARVGRGWAGIERKTGEVKWLGSN